MQTGLCYFNGKKSQKFTFSSLVRWLNHGETNEAPLRAAQQNQGPLLLLLDKGDMVLAPSLVPAMELLDQSRDFTALLAMRPGHASQLLANAGSGGVAGDHYHVVHLGVSPRSVEWSTFMMEAIRAQLGNRVHEVSFDSRAWMTAISRDSLKTALELG